MRSLKSSFAALGALLALALFMGAKPAVAQGYYTPDALGTATVTHPNGYDDYINYSVDYTHMLSRGSNTQSYQSIHKVLHYVVFSDGTPGYPTLGTEDYDICDNDVNPWTVDSGTKVCSGTLTTPVSYWAGTYNWGKVVVEVHYYYYFRAYITNGSTNYGGDYSSTADIVRSAPNW